MNNQLVNSVGEIHFGALFGLVDEVTSLLKITLENTGSRFVSILLELKLFLHTVPIGEDIQIMAR